MRKIALFLRRHCFFAQTCRAMQCIRLVCDYLVDCPSPPTPPTNLRDKEKEFGWQSDLTWIRPHLYLSGERGASAPDLWETYNIHWIISIGYHPDTHWHHPDMQYMYVPIQDSEKEPIHKYFVSTSKRIQSTTAKGKGVLVHCQFGQSRSPTIVAAHLMQVERLGELSALKDIASRRANVRPNSDFRRQLQEFQLTLGID